jgi:hypothetical protein
MFTILLMIGAAILFPAYAQSVAPQVVDFSVTPDTIDRGGQITLHWDVQGLEQVSIFQFYGGYRDPYDLVYRDLPASGSMTLYLTYTQPNYYQAAQPYVYSATFFLMPSDAEFSWYEGERPLADANVHIRCPYDRFFFSTDPEGRCPIAPPQTIDAIYQPFEHGYMLQRSDTGTIYVLITNFEVNYGIDFAAERYSLWETAPMVWTFEMPPDTTYDFPADWNASRSAPVPENLYPPMHDFARVWYNSHDIRLYDFGWASAPESHYQATVQDAPNAAFITHPDGDVIEYDMDTTGGGAFWKIVD